MLFDQYQAVITFILVKEKPHDEWSRGWKKNTFQKCPSLITKSQSLFLKCFSFVFKSHIPYQYNLHPLAACCFQIRWVQSQPTPHWSSLHCCSLASESPQTWTHTVNFNVIIDSIVLTTIHFNDFNTVELEQTGLWLSKFQQRKLTACRVSVYV